MSYGIIIDVLYSKALNSLQYSQFGVISEVDQDQRGLLFGNTFKLLAISTPFRLDSYILIDRHRIEALMRTAT